MALSLPITDPVLTVALAALLFLVAPVVSRWLRLPEIIGLIVAGAVVGPNLLGLLERDATINLLGTVGLLYLMFMAGLELDLLGFARYRNRSLIFGSLSFALPFLLALLVMTWLGFGLAATLLIGAIVASHTLLAYPITSRLGIAKDAAVTAVVGGTLLTDVLSLLVLALIDGALTGGGVLFWLRLGGSLVLYTAVVLWGLPRLGRWFFRNTESGATPRFFFLLSALFVSAYLAEAAGAQPIIGAFLAGLTLNRFVPEQGSMMTRVRFFGEAFFIPFFLLSVGMLVDVGVLFGSPDVLFTALALTGVVLVGKVLAAVVSQLLFGFRWTQGVLMAGLSIPQAAATLAVTFVGLDIGLFDEAVVNAVIVLILLSSLVGSSLVERFGRRLVLAVETAPYTPDTAPHRILVPLANPATAEALLGIALLIREPDSREALFPLTVVNDDAESEQGVASAERTLAHAVVYAAEADVVATPLTRVAQNPASGVVRTVRDARITDIILGWRGERSTPLVVFGSMIDQTINQTEQQVLVCRLTHPVNTFGRLVLILPPFIDYNPGFYQALQTLKRLAARLGLSVLMLVVTDDTDRLRGRFDEVEPKLDATLRGLIGWNALDDTLQDSLDDHDLVTLISARQGTVAHTGRLEHLPLTLARLASDVIVLYPSERTSRDVTAPVTGELPPLLSAERTLFDLPETSYAEVVEKLLATTFAPGSKRDAIAQMLVYDDVGYATEVLPGMLVAHARSKTVKEPLMFLGLSRAGIKHARSQRPVQVVALLLSPLDASPQAHLARLAENTQYLHENGPPDVMASCDDMESLRAWFAGQSL